MYLPSGSREELSLRTASIVAVERVRQEILNAIKAEESGTADDGSIISSVVIDFYLWDLAKRLEAGLDSIEGIATADMVPIHRTRSIWY